MNATETGQLLERISQLFPLGPAPSDIGPWLSAMGDVTLEAAVLAVTDLHGTAVPTVTPDVLLDAITRLRRYQMGPSYPPAVRPAPRAELVPTPPWTREARKAAQRAAEACSERGLPPGHPITIASCAEAAAEVQREWEATYGRWDSVWRHWEDTPVAPAVPGASVPDPVTPGGRPVPSEESPW